MTLAERVMFEREHGKGSVPPPQPPKPESLEDLRSDVQNKRSRIEGQRAELDARKMRIKEEFQRIERLKRGADEETPMCSSPTPSVSRPSTISRPNSISPTRGQTPRSIVGGKQYCVSPIFAIKRFFTDWTVNGRSSRSELWWIMLLVQFPLLTLERVVGDTDLLMMVGVVELVLLWPFACLEGRRFHDIGWSAAVGIILVLLRSGAAIAGGYYGDTSPSAFGGGLIGFIILLANLAESRPANKYGPVPNTR